MIEDNVNNEDQPGRKKGTGFRLERSLLNDLDAAAAEIKQKSGFNITRSKLVALACEILMESHEAIRIRHVRNRMSLHNEYVRAISVSAAANKNE